LNNLSLKKAIKPVLSRLKPISEFLSDAIEAFKDIDFPSAIEKVAPWAGLVTDTVSEVAPPSSSPLSYWKS
jgi:hypothetical protein